MDWRDLDIRYLQVVDSRDGQVYPINLATIKDGGSFNKVFLGELSEMIGCTGSGAMKVLGWIFNHKNNKNEVFGTQREVAEESKVTLPTVSKVYKSLIDNKFMRLKRSGMYILNPKVMHYGADGNKFAILKVWESL